MDYSKAKQTAMRMISKNGMTYQVVRGGGVEVVNGIEQTKEEKTFEVKGVRFTYSKYEQANGLIETGDIKMMAVSDVDIQVGDFIIIDNQKYRVINTNPFKPADVVIYYELQLRC